MGCVAFGGWSGFLFVLSFGIGGWFAWLVWSCWLNSLCLNDLFWCVLLVDILGVYFVCNLGVHFWVWCLWNFLILMWLLCCYGLRGLICLDLDLLAFLMIDLLLNFCLFLEWIYVYFGWTLLVAVFALLFFVCLIASLVLVDWFNVGLLLWFVIWFWFCELYLVVVDLNLLLVGCCYWFLDALCGFAFCLVVICEY